MLERPDYKITLPRRTPEFTAEECKRVEVAQSEPLPWDIKDVVEIREIFDASDECHWLLVACDPKLSETTILSWGSPGEKIDEEFMKKYEIANNVAPFVIFRSQVYLEQLA